MNFRLNYREHWDENRKTILNQLNLQFVEIRIDENNLLDNIIQQISNEFPVIMIVKYGSLFYSRYYKWGDYNHGLILSDYDLEKKIIGVRDREFVREHIDNGLIKSDILHRTPLDFEHIKDIWSYSNDMFKKEDLWYKNTIFSIEGTKKQEISFIDIAKSCSQMKNLKNYFREYVENTIYNNKEIVKSEEEAVRRVFYRSFDTLYHCMEIELNENPEVLNKAFKTKNELTKLRLDILNKLQLQLLRKEKISISAYQPLLCLEESIVQELFELLDEIVKY